MGRHSKGESGQAGPGKRFFLLLLGLAGLGVGVWLFRSKRRDRGHS
jgi:LPXTG-motif cell wall-anchored protein